MCGIFGFITKIGRGPDLARLRRLAAETQRRGHHAFGLAWLGPGGELHTFKRPGPATANLGDVGRCRGATIVLGHCRWATHGAPEDNRNNHPHPAGRGWLVHNGVVHNYTGLLRRHRLRPATECDSEVLGLLMMRPGGSIGRRAAWAVAQTEGPLAMLGLWADPARLLVARRGNPLCFGETEHGIYFASLPDGLPGNVLSITDRYAGVLRFQDGGINHQAISIRA